MAEFDEIPTLNRESLGQFKSFLATLSDSELSTPMPAGWTVSAVLAHLAVWDKRVLTMLEKWQKDGIEFSPIDADIINEVTKPLCLAVPPRESINLFIQTAETLDKLIAQFDPTWIDEIQQKGKNVRLNRAKHRLQHLEEIKAVLL